MSDSNRLSRPARSVSGLLVLLAAVLLVRATPIVKLYADRVRAALESGTVAAATGALTLAFIILFIGIWRAPRVTAGGAGLICLFLVVRSGNALALLAAAAVLGLTLVAGDGLARLLRGRETEGEELPVLLAAGCVGLGALLFLLGEAGLVKAPILGLAAASLVLFRRRRLSELVRQLGHATRALAAGSHSKAEALWLTIVAAVVFTGFLGALGPDLSWDALATHLPQIRDFAEKGRVRPLPNLYPVTLVWRHYDTYLGLGFMAGGERAVRLVHLAIALAAFGSIAVLARRLGGGRAHPLVLLALAAFPAAGSQLKETYVDLPAAFFLTSAAAEIAASGREPRRTWLAGFLFGGAVATKIFSLLGAAGLGILWIRRQTPSVKRLLPFVLAAAIPLVPWLAWNQSKLGFFLAPYYDPWRAQRSNPQSPHYGPPSDPGGVRSRWDLEGAGFLRLPYDLAFHRSLFGRSDGYTGLLPLLLLVGAFGWGRRKFALFSAAAIAAILPWYVATNLGLIAFSNRYLIPIYPLYAVFTALGLARLTDNFRGRPGGAAAVSVAALAVAYPMRLLSGPHDLSIALGRDSRESALASLPSYPLWTHVHKEDRVLLLGDPDRYHCPAGLVVNDVIIHQTRKVDPSRWQTEWRPLGINVIVHRTDRRDAKPFFESLGDCLHPVASHGVARLYRVDVERADCAPTPGSAVARAGEEAPDLSRTPDD